METYHNQEYTRFSAVYARKVTIFRLMLPPSKKHESLHSKNAKGCGSLGLRTHRLRIGGSCREHNCYSVSCANCWWIFDNALALWWRSKKHIFQNRSYGGAWLILTSWQNQWDNLEYFQIWAPLSTPFCDGQLGCCLLCCNRVYCHCRWRPPLIIAFISHNRHNFLG